MDASSDQIKAYSALSSLLDSSVFQCNKSYRPRSAKALLGVYELSFCIRQKIKLYFCAVIKITV